MNEQQARELTGRRRELLDILPGLRRFAFSLTGEPSAADDLLHATVARVLKRGLPIEAELAPWCIRVCRDAWLEENRAAGSGAQHDAMAMDGGSHGSTSPEPVQGALRALLDEQRAVLELVAIEGHSYGATAAMLDLPIGRIMSRLARARGALIESCRPGRQAPLERRAANHD